MQVTTMRAKSFQFDSCKFDEINKSEIIFKLGEVIIGSEPVFDR